MNLNDPVNIFWNIFGLHNWDTYLQYSCTVSGPQLCQIRKFWRLSLRVLSSHTLFTGDMNLNDPVNIFWNVLLLQSWDMYLQYSCLVSGPQLCQIRKNSRLSLRLLSSHTLFPGDINLYDPVNIFWIFKKLHTWDTYLQYSCTVSWPQLCQIRKISRLSLRLLSFHTLFTGDMNLNDPVNIFWNIFGLHNWDTYLQYSCTISGPQLCQIQKIRSLSRRVLSSHTLFTGDMNFIVCAEFPHNVYGTLSQDLFTRSMNFNNSVNIVWSTFWLQKKE